MRCLLVAVWTLSLTPGLAPAAPPEKKPPDEALPEGALVRLGHARLRFGERDKVLAVSPDGRWITDGSTWFDLVEGKKQPAPIHIPEGYQFWHWFADGSYVVAGQM